LLRLGFYHWVLVSSCFFVVSAASMATGQCALGQLMAAPTIFVAVNSCSSSHRILAMARECRQRVSPMVAASKAIRPLLIVSSSMIPSLPSRALVTGFRDCVMGFLFFCLGGLLVFSDLSLWHNAGPDVPYSGVIVVPWQWGQLPTSVQCAFSSNPHRVHL
jgi:hypothetical protein